MMARNPETVRRQKEKPTPIADDVRARWKDTWLREGEYILVDEQMNELARVPFNETNLRHYNLGPEKNIIVAEQKILEQTNEQRRALGLREFRTFAQIGRGDTVRSVTPTELEPDTTLPLDPGTLSEPDAPSVRTRRARGINPASPNTSAQNQPNTPSQTPPASPNAVPNTPPQSPSATPNTPRQTPPQSPPNAQNSPPPVPNAPLATPTIPPVVPIARRGGGGFTSGSGTMKPMGLESFYKRRDKSAEIDRQKTIVNPVSGEGMDAPPETTVGEIMGDADQQKLFVNTFLARENEKFAKEFAKKNADGKLLTAAEDKELERLRKKFIKEMSEVQSVKEYLTPEHFKRIAEVDPRIAEVVGKIGHEKAEDLMEAELTELMVTDPAKFRKMRNALKSFHDLDHSPRVARVEADIRKSQAKIGMSEDEFLAATKLGSPTAVEKRFHELAHERLPLLGRALNFGGWINKRSVQELSRHYASQEAIMQDADKHMKAVGSVLQATLNPEMRLRIQKLAMEGILEEKVPDTINTIEDYRAVKHENSPMAMQTAFDEIKAAEAAKNQITNWADPTNAARLDSLKDSFAKSAYEKQKKQKTSGLYAILLRVLFGKSSDDIKNKLK